MRILGTPLRAPCRGVNMVRAVRSAAAMFVCPPLMSTLSMALSSDRRSPYLLRWKTISTPLLNFTMPTCVRFLSMGNEPAIRLAKPSTWTYQLSYCGSPTTMLVDWSITSIMSAALGQVTLLTANIQQQQQRNAYTSYYTQIQNIIIIVTIIFYALRCIVPKG